MSRNNLSIEIIEKWLKSNDYEVRATAIEACNGKNVPLEVIEKGLKDSDRRVRAAAMNACKKAGIPIPIIRTIEPPQRVYKKCVGGVIVVAEIPKDAQIRGKIIGKCRTNKAKIVDIIGDFAGEKVGIFLCDQTTTYCIGDHIKIDNFDMSDKECSTGFHFFCTIEQAQNY